MKKIVDIKIHLLLALIAFLPTLAYASPSPLVQNIGTVNEHKILPSTRAAKKLGDPILTGHYFSMKNNPYLVGYLAYEKATAKYQLKLASYQYKVAKIRAKNQERIRKQEEKKNMKLAMLAAKLKNSADTRRSGSGLLRSAIEQKPEAPAAEKSAEPAEKPARVLTKSDDVETDGTFVLRRKSEEPVASAAPETSETTDQDTQPSLWFHFKRALIGR